MTRGAEDVWPRPGEVRLIATLGPASATPAAVRALIEAGASAARLNASHMEEHDLETYVETGIAGGLESDRIVVDLQGGKTRLTALRTPLEVRVGQTLCLTSGPASLVPGADPPCLGVDRPAFLDALQVGDTVRIDDGRITLTMLDGNPPVESGRMARVTVGGRIEGRKGLALVGRAPDLGLELLDRDSRLLQVALELGIRDFAISYASSPALLDAVRAAAYELSEPGTQGARIRIHAKLEQPSALDRLEELLPAADFLWLCRGDLGAEAGLEQLPALQARVLRSVIGRVPLLIAGQVLHHMTVSRNPTRSEVCHVADLAWRGVDGFVLSDETARGPYGPEAIRWLKRLTDAARDAGQVRQRND